jgi:hypothetical protein
VSAGKILVATESFLRAYRVGKIFCACYENLRRGKFHYTRGQYFDRFANCKLARFVWVATEHLRLKS